MAHFVHLASMSHEAVHRRYAGCDIPYRQAFWVLS